MYIKSGIYTLDTKSRQHCVKWIFLTLKENIKSLGFERYCLIIVRIKFFIALPENFLTNIK